MIECGFIGENGESSSKLKDFESQNPFEKTVEKNLVIFRRNLNMTLSQLTAVSILSIYFYLTWAYFSLITPFFPGEAMKKGMNSSKIGIVFGVYQLVLLLLQPVFGKYLNKIGVKFLFVSGILLGSGSALAFGFMKQSPSGWTYFIMCLLCRSVSGIGASMGLTYAIVGYFFPNRIASFVALLEVCCGLGIMTGPVLGGFLYQIGGFGLPFFAIGGIQLLLFVLAFFFFPSPQNTTTANSNSPEPSKNGPDSVPMLPLFKIPRFSLTLLMLFCGCVSLNFIEPNVQLHLMPLNLEPVELGFVFFVPAFLYLITTPFVGYFCDKFPKSQPWIMIIGAVLSMFSFCFIGPLPFLNMQLKLSTFLFGFGLFVVSYTGLIIPVYAELITIALDNGYPNDMKTQGLISGIFGAINSLGALLGTSLGGFVVDWIGFQMGTVLIAIMFFIVGILYTISYIFSICCPSSRQVNLDDDLAKEKLLKESNY